MYRGPLLSVDEFEYIRFVCKSKQPIFKLVTFSSASLDREVVMNFLTSSDDRIPCLFEIIITDDHKFEQGTPLDIRKMFENISSSSAMPEEQEVLFRLLTHFRVNALIVHDYQLCLNSSKIIRHITLTVMIQAEK